MTPPVTDTEDKGGRAAPNVPGCTCEWRGDDWDGDETEEPVLCPKHEYLLTLRPLTVAIMYIDLEAALYRAETR